LGFIENVLGIFGESVKVIFKYPVFAVPLLIVWLFVAPTILYFQFFFNSDALSTIQAIGILFCVIYFLSLLFTFSCVIMLELIQQHESGKPLDLGAAFSETIHKNLIAILFISLIWAIVWTLLTIIKAIASSSKKKNSGSRPPPTPQAAAAVLAGTGGTFSWIKLGISMIEKIFRMFIYLVLPAVAWENKSAFAALGRGWNALKSHPAEFLGATMASGLVSFVVFLPAVLVIMFVKTAPDYVWYLVILYTAAAWIFSMYVEQMTVALLYLWHMKWEKAVAAAESEGKPKPSISDIPQPSLLDDINEFAPSEQPSAV